MNDVQEKPRALDRRPTVVPHHPKVLTIAAIITGAALLFMGAWFWQVMTSPGLIMTEDDSEQTLDPGADQLQSDRDRLAESAQQDPTGQSDGKGGPPEAPDENVPVTSELELSGYSILSTNGILQVGGTLTNTSNQPLTGTVRVYVYTDAVPVATAKTEIDDLQPGESESANMVSDSDWEAGEKVILLDFEPSKTTNP